MFTLVNIYYNIQYIGLFNSGTLKEPLYKNEMKNTGAGSFNYNRWLYLVYFYIVFMSNWGNEFPSGAEFQRS